jgi:hypothetical protein
MKLKSSVFYLSILFTLFLIQSCSFPRAQYQGCDSANNSQDRGNQFMPLERGNLWEYQIRYEDDYLASLSLGEREELRTTFRLELGEEITIYDNSNGEMSAVTAFQTIMNGWENPYHYFFRCGKQIHFAEVGNGETRIIKAAMRIFSPNKDTSVHWDAVDRSRFDTKSVGSRRAAPGQDDCINISEYAYNIAIVNPDDKHLRQDQIWKFASRTRFCKGKGLTGKDFFDKDGELIAKMNLAKFTPAAK